MKIEQAPRCPKSPRHNVYRLPKLPLKILAIPNDQGSPTTKIIELEDPPWWCDACGLQIATGK